MGDNVHKGHRKRVKDKFLLHDLDVFEEHEILELLLFYAIPQRDTNPISHRLLDQFGTISGVLDATPAALRSAGISDNTVALLKLIPALSRVYCDDKFNNRSKIIGSRNFDDYFKNKFLGRQVEYLYLLLLDSKYKEMYSGVISKGSLTEADVPIKRIIELCSIYDARYAVIAHNHLNGVPLPSGADLEITKDLCKKLRLLNIELLDHVIVADELTFSLKNSKFEDAVFYPNDDD